MADEREPVVEAWEGQQLPDKAGFPDACLALDDGDTWRMECCGEQELELLLPTHKHRSRKPAPGRILTRPPALSDDWHNCGRAGHRVDYSPYQRRLSGAIRA